MKPRPIFPDTTYLVTRRTTQRLFLLRPSRQINACIMYCLALAQRRAKVKIHSAVFLSNHYHLVVSDPGGKMPLFTEELNKLLARTLNCLHGRSENLWSANDQASYVRLASEHDVLAKTIYTLANPTAALLVSSGNQWPGVRLFRKGHYAVKKPAFFFRSEKAGGLPDKLHVTLTPPPIGAQTQLVDDIVNTAVAAREKQIRERAKAEGKTFMGAAAVKAQSIDRAPKSSPPRRGISPRIACRDKWRRIELLGQLGQFVAEHAEKRKAFLAGLVDVVFPPGTYRFVHQFGARCAEV